MFRKVYRDVRFQAIARIQAFVKSKFLHFNLFSTCFWRLLAQIYTLFQAVSFGSANTSPSIMEILINFSLHFSIGVDARLKFSIEPLPGKKAFRQVSVP